MRERFNQFFIKFLTVLLLLTSFYNDLFIRVNAATATPTISGQPQSITVDVGSEATFLVTATASGTISYQWEESKDSGDTWTPIDSTSNASAATKYLVLSNVTESMDTYQYRVILTGSDAPDSPVTSNAVTLTVLGIAEPSTDVYDLDIFYDSIENKFYHVIWSEIEQSEVFSEITQFTLTPDIYYYAEEDSKVKGTLTYQWYQRAPSGEWVEMTGETSSTLTITIPSDLTLIHDYDYKISATNTVGESSVTSTTMWSGTVYIYLKNQPTVTGATDQSTEMNGTATFTVTATPSTGFTTSDISYVWYKASNNSYTYDLSELVDNGQYYLNDSEKVFYSGHDTNSLTIESFALSNDYYTNWAGNHFFASVIQNYTYTDPNGTNTLTLESYNSPYEYNNYELLSSILSNLALLTIELNPVIYTDVTDEYAAIGESATFTVNASSVGSGANLYKQWEISTDNVNWTSITGATASNYYIASTQASDFNKYYRVKLTNTYNGQEYIKYSSVGQLLEKAYFPDFTGLTGPSDLNIEISGSATFSSQYPSTIADGGTLTYYWQKSSNGSSWTTISTPSTNYEDLTITEIPYVYNNTYYRLAVTNTKTDANKSTSYSSVATLTVNKSDDPSITSNLNQFAEVISGNTLTLNVIATDPDSDNTLSYQWQKSTNSGSTWSDISGATLDTYQTPALSTSDNFTQYRVIIYNESGTDVNGWGSVISTATEVNVIIASLPEILSQPSSSPVAENAPKTFSVSATTSDSSTLTYQWQVCTVADCTIEANWLNIGTDSTSYSVTATTSNVGDSYRVIVTNTLGDTSESVTSSTAKIAFNAVEPSLADSATGPANISADIYGDKVFFSITPSAPSDGGTLSYAWEYSTNGTNWASVSEITGYTDETGTKFYPYTNSADTINAIKYEYNGYQFRVIITNTLSDDNTTTYTSTAATLTVNPATTPSVSIADQQGASSESITFEPTYADIYAVNEVTSVAYKWYELIDTVWVATSDTTSTLTIDSLSYTDDGRQFKIEVTNTRGDSSTTASDTLTLKIDALAPSVSTQPATTTSANIAGSAEFVVEGTSDDSGTITYQWQVCMEVDCSIEANWIDLSDSVGVVSGSSTTTLTLEDIDYSMNGYKYRSIITNTKNSTTDTITSNYSTLSVNKSATPSITTQPVDKVVTSGTSATFTVTATTTDSGTLKYQWQLKSTEDGAQFENINGATSASYTVSSVTDANDGYAYQVIITNELGSVSDGYSTVTSSAAYAYVMPVLPTIVTAPVSTQVIEGENASFTVAASTTDAGTLTYQWQVCTAFDCSSSDWIDLEGETSTTLTLNSVTASMDWNHYRVVVTNTKGDQTNFTSTSLRTLNVFETPTITQPSNQTVDIGDDVSFVSGASSNDGSTITYQWLYNDPTIGWVGTDGYNYDSSSYITGTLDTLSYINIPYIEGVHSFKLEIISTRVIDGVDVSKKFYSNEVTLTVNKTTAPVIYTQPTDVYASLNGNSETMSVVVTDLSIESYVYQWQVCDSALYGTDDETWTDVTNNGDDPSKLTISDVVAANDNDYYRVIITNEIGTVEAGWSSVTSNAVQLFIYPVAPTVTSYTRTYADEATYINPTKNETLVANITDPEDGGTLSYQWQVWEINQFVDLSNGTYSIDVNGVDTTVMSVAGVTSKSLELTNVAYAMNQSRYQLVVTNTKGSKTAISAFLDVYLNVRQPAQKPVFTYLVNNFTSTQNIGADPIYAADINISNMGVVTFKWQVSTDDGDNWSYLSDTSSTDITHGTGTPITYSQLKLNDVTYAMNGNLYRVEATNSINETTAVEYSGIVTLVVNPPAEKPSVDTQPEDVKETLGGSVTFTAVGSSSDDGEITYQWEYWSGTAWVAIPGATSSTYTIDPIAEDDDTQYRAVITNSINDTTDTIETNSVSLDVVVVKRPEFDQTLPTVITTEGNSVTYYANASTSDEGTLTYQWEISTDGGETWTTISGATNDSYTVSNVTTSMSGYQYRVEVTNTLNDEFISQTTNAATLTVNAKVVSSSSSTTTTTPTTTNTTPTTTNTTITNNTTDTDEEETEVVPTAEDERFYSTMAVTKNTDGTTTTSLSSSTEAAKPLISGISSVVNLPEKDDENVESVVVELQSESKVVTSEDVSDDVKNTLAIMSEEGTSFEFMYDLSLLKTVTHKDGTVETSTIENEDITGELIIRLPIPETLLPDSNHRIVYIAEDGTTQVIESTRVEMDGVSYLEFRINHFSYYAVVADKFVAAVEEVVEESNNLFIYLGSGFVVILLALIWFIIAKLRKDEEEYA